MLCLHRDESGDAVGPIVLPDFLLLLQDVRYHVQGLTFVKPWTKPHLHRMFVDMAGIDLSK